MHFLQSNKALVATVFLICIAPFSILSQSQSSLYQKAEVAYDEYNYAFLLDNKDALLKQYGQKDDTLSANIHSFIAEAFLVEYGDPIQSLEYYQKELSIREKLGLAAEAKDLLYNIAAIQDELGMFAQAEKAYIKLLESDAKDYGKKSAEYLETVIALGIHYEYAKQSDIGVKLIKSNLKYAKTESEYFKLLFMSFTPISDCLAYS